MSQEDRKCNIFLAGMMGSGKTTIGAAVAKQLFYMFIDTDANIETIEKMSVREIFENKGEPYFREREQIVLEELLPREFQVVATGGGMLANEGNLQAAQENGFVVFLEASIKTLVERLQHAADRPLLDNGELESRLEEIEKERRDTYQKISCKIITDGKNVEECANLVIESYNAWLVE